MKKILCICAITALSMNVAYCAMGLNILIDAFIDNLGTNKDSKADADSLIILYNATGRKVSPLKVRNALNNSDINDYKGKISNNDDIPKAPAGLGGGSFDWSNGVKGASAEVKFNALFNPNADQQDKVGIAAVDAIVQLANSDKNKTADVKKALQQGIDTLTDYLNKIK